MEKFEDLVKKYYKLIHDYDNWAHHFSELPIEQINLFNSALVDIYENVKLPGNRAILLQELSAKGKVNAPLVLRDSSDVSKILMLQTLLAGRLQKVDEEEFYKFALDGDSGYSNLRVECVTNVVNRELAGIDFIKKEEALSV